MTDIVSQAKSQLKAMIEPYLPAEQVDIVMRASDFADKAHEGVTRQSGEPYITHPIAVTCILARMRLDADILMAGLLHDVIEDTPISKDEIAETFNPTVAELVDGVTKLTSSSDKQFNKAASFRKFLQATLQDPRTLVIKLADRYHNMTTLGALRPDKRARIAQETFDIYVPMARLVGMNEMGDWLENLCYQNLDLDLYASVQSALENSKSDRCNYQSKWEQSLTQIMQDNEIVGRFKKKNNNTKLLRNFFKNRITLEQLSFSHDFDVIVQSIQDCDILVKILSKKFTVVHYTDHIRHPLPGGNQALLLDLKNDKSYISLTIQTELMRSTSRFGVVLGDSVSQSCRSAIQASLHNLNEVIDDDSAKQTFSDLLDYLHQKKIIAYTPQGNVFEIPRGATAVDFAYTVSRFLGNHAIGCKIDGEKKPLSTPIQHGQTINIITDVLATPNPDWLSFVVTQKARRAIQHELKDQSEEDLILIGKQALDRSFRLFNRTIKDLTDEEWQSVLVWRHHQHKDELFKEIALGELLPQLIANKLFHEDTQQDGQHNDSLILGANGVEIKYAQCCNPVLGDEITGHLTRRGLIVHRAKCQNLAQQQRLHPENIMPLHWHDENTENVQFNAYLVINKALTDEDVSRIIHQARKIDAGVESIRQENDKTYFNIVVYDRQHIAKIIRDLRMILDFPTIKRLYVPVGQAVPSTNA